MDDSHKERLQLLPIADTIGGTAARENPRRTLDHYNHLANQLWLSSKVSDVADGVFLRVQQGYTAWGSLSGPYGFGKTASAIALWAHAKDSEFLAIPPLSCTSFDELASGIAALAGEQNPKIKKQINKLFEDVFTKGLNPMVQEDAKRYSVPSRRVRQIYQDKFSAGQFTLDSQSRRTVEFLSKLGALAAKDSKGLVIILDELQQLLGPLDARTIVQFREFVWGMRTERSPCGIILALDSLLEAKLARWAADILHRIRENGPSLQLTDIYTREFPAWLWDQLVNDSRKSGLIYQSEALSENVLLSLGQLVERPDLANGPRTVVDVFTRAVTYHQETGSSYDIPNLVSDVHQGQFRYFGEGATIQSVLTHILSDEWISQDEERKTLVTTLAAFPQGCSQEMLQCYLPDKKQLKKTRSELFAPLLVELSEGLALERLQQVRRINTNWEQILSRCWETLPALDALAAQAPSMILRTLIPKLFPKGTPAKPDWERLSDDSNAILTGWYILRGTFDDNYPQREIALCVSDKEPESWPWDVDACIALVCDSSVDPDVTPRAELLDKDDGCFILMRLPILRPLEDRIPAELQRHGKHIQPEPFRPATILAALHDLEAFLGDQIDNSDDADVLTYPEEQAEVKQVTAFVNITVDFVLRELLAGTVDVGISTPISLRGPELLRALFTQACRRRFPEYQTLTRTEKWQEILSNYREGVSSDWLNPAQRQGLEDIITPKVEMYETLFGQKSTAAGDSFIKKLGTFVEIKKDSESFALRLAMHPAENTLIDYLKKFAANQFIPLNATVEFLRHHGYIHTETEEIVKILVARECLTKDPNGNIRFIPSPEIERGRLLQQIAEMDDQLCRLGITDDTNLISQNTSTTNLQKHLQQQQARLESFAKEEISNLESSITSLQELIGTVSVPAISTEWLDSDLSRHLTGIAIKLKDTQKNLLRTLRRELKGFEEELDTASSLSGVEWVVIQQNKKELSFNTLQKLQERVKQFETRVKGLTSWEVLINQLHSTATLCEKVSETEATPIRALSQLVDEFKERFAVDSWSPLFTSSEFADRLGTIQSDVQARLYELVQVFNRELEEIRNQFNILLPSTQPPTFNVSVKDNQRGDLIQESFQKLYQWACTGFRAGAIECQRKRQNGSQWRNPDKRRRSWKTLEAQIEEEFQKVEARLDFETVQNIGAMVLVMQRGFTSAEENEDIFGLYDNPDDPPDFNKLGQLFRQGKIQIQVKPKA
ncbi:hypothetical protein C6502_07970 [Candidatus Poribacteria bacterium]|nr:MAG: hypothetical protein C6502_07970 [Candidatus Poribacteria bacterium]